MDRKLKNRVIFWAALVMLCFIAGTGAGCLELQKNLDVVGKGSIVSFDAVMKAIPDNVAADEVNGGWSLLAPDGSVRFIWGDNFSRTPLYDVMLEFDAAPFLKAGLDPEKLPEQFVFFEDRLMVGRNLGDDALEYSEEKTPLAAFEQIVDKKRDSIGYHAQFDHYGVDVGNGNMFEWAKDMRVNDKDIVFVLEPEPFVSAGVSPEAVDGWLFAKVTVKVGGKMAEVDKFLKPFDLQ